jgi:hypothetical protein
MKKQVYFLSLLIAVSPLNVPLSAGGSQEAASSSQEQTSLRRRFAISLLRTINTAEVGYRIKRGMYVPWDVLLASPEFTERGMHWAAQIDPQLKNTQFTRGPEILPGWSLRLNVTADGQGYDLMLEDLTDKACGYAAVTDERGLIRQSKAIDCDI